MRFRTVSRLNPTANDTFQSNAEFNSRRCAAKRTIMSARILLTRKLLFYWRKAKFRKVSERGPESSGREPCGNVGGMRRPEVKTNRFPFRRNSARRLATVLAIPLIVSFLPNAICFPRPEIVSTSDSRTNATERSGTFSNRTFDSATENAFETEILRGGSDDNEFDYVRETNLTKPIAKTNYNQDGIRLKRNERHVREKPKRKPLFVTDDVQNYLMTFGYLPPSDKETGLLRTDDQLRNAIKNLQNFANIPATGELDETTLDLLKKPRCGLPDFPNPFSSTSFSKRKKRYTLHGQKWHYTNLTWSLRTLQPRNLDGGRVRGVLYHALDVWAKHSKLTFQELNSDRADILVYFHSGYHGDGYAFDGRGQVLAHAFFPGKERGGDAHFDEDEIWILDPYADLEKIEGTSLFSVAAHEFGHSLGLSHSSVQGALMFPWYQGYEGLTPDLQLPDDDKHAIQQLYGPKDTKLWAKIPTYGPHQPERPRPEHPRTERPRPEPPRPTVPTRPTTTPAPRPRGPRPTVPPPRVPYPRPRPRFPEKFPEKPDTCNTSYDAISVIRNEVFIFKGKYLWRIGDQGLRREYPAEISRLWYGFPRELTHVDAVYERNDKKIVFFVGKMYYVFDANYLMPGYPKPIHYLGLPRELERVDAAMVWGHNGKTYFFSGTMYWRFDEEVGRVELDYPRDMSMWRGVGYNIDAVFQWKDGKMYFFKNKGFWKFNDMRMRVENEKQTLSATFWMGCPRTTELEEPEPTKPTTKRQIASSSSTPISTFHCLLIGIASFYSIIVSTKI